jgi:hypothetical protein
MVGESSADEELPGRVGGRIRENLPLYRFHLGVWIVEMSTDIGSA